MHQARERINIYPSLVERAVSLLLEMKGGKFWHEGGHSANTEMRGENGRNWTEPG